VSFRGSFFFTPAKSDPRNHTKRHDRRSKQLPDIEFVVLLSYSLAQSLQERNWSRHPIFKTASLQVTQPLPTLHMILGTEWVIDAVGCNPTILTDLGKMRAVFDRVILDLDLHVQGEMVWHQFSLPFGVSGLALLSESHLACHTYPEFGAATFNLYCCRNRASWPWEARLKEMLGATTVTVRVLDRSMHEDVPELEQLLGTGARE
jgi:S-adenosylmethionine decarboxylase